MATKLKTRTLNKSSDLMQSRVARECSTNSSTQHSTVSDAKSLLNSGTLENIEIEYIKNLQTQVYFLELECNYLREQLDKHGLSSKFKANASLTIKQQQQQQNKNHDDVVVGGKSLDSLNQMLNEAKRNFEHEKQTLLDELSALKHENATLRERTDVLNSERNQTQTTLEIHHQELRRSKENYTQLDTQLDQTRKDNTRLRSELTELKLQLNNREQLLVDLRKHVDELKNKKTSSSELRASVTELNTKLTRETENSKYLEEDKQRLLKEVANYQQQLSDYKLEIQRLNHQLETSLRQNENDLVLAQKNASILKSNVEQLESTLNEQKLLNNKLQTQIEEYVSHERVETKNTLALKSRTREIEELLEVRNAKVLELTHERDELLNRQRMTDGEHGKLLHQNDSLQLRMVEYEKKIKDVTAFYEDTIRNREHQFELVRNKTDALQRSLDEQLTYLKSEKGNNKSLKVQNDSLVLQDQTNQKLVASLKGRINDLELALHQSEAKQNEILALRNELGATGTQLNNKEDEIHFLRQQNDSLQARLNETERLKDMEKVIKSQHWEEFGAIAESMKNLTRQFNRKNSTSTNHHQQQQPESPVIGFETLIISSNAEHNQSFDHHHSDTHHQMPQPTITNTETVFQSQSSEPSAPPTSE